MLNDYIFINDFNNDNSRHLYMFWNSEELSLIQFKYGGSVLSTEILFILGLKVLLEMIVEFYKIPFKYALKL